MEVACANMVRTIVVSAASNPSYGISIATSNCVDAGVGALVCATEAEAAQANVSTEVVGFEIIRTYATSSNRS